MSLTPAASRLFRESYLELFMVAGSLLSEKALAPDDAEHIRQYAVKLLEQNRQQLLMAGVPEGILHDTQRPLIAMLDEAAAQLAGFRDHWRSLSHQFYSHTRLGHEVFERLEVLRRDPDTPVELLELYGRCIAWGLQGQYSPDRLSALRDVHESLNRDISHRQGLLPPLIPPLETSKRSDHSAWIVSPWWVAGLVLFSLLMVWGGLQCQFSEDVSRTSRDVGTASETLRGIANQLSNGGP